MAGRGSLMGVELHNHHNKGTFNTLIWYLRNKFKAQLEREL
jgi:hypothetical protein